MPSTSDFISTAVASSSIDQWLTATPYTVDQYVEESRKLYRCIANHTSTTFAADKDSNWVEISRAFDDWTFAANNDTAQVLNSYILTPSNTINMPVSPADGDAVRFATLTEWSAASITFTAPGATTVAAGQVGVIAGYDVVEFVYSSGTDNWVALLGGSAAPDIAIPLDASTADLTITLPAATGLGAIKRYVVRNKTNDIDFAVQSGEYINEVLNDTYRASNHGVGAYLEAIDSDTGKWSLAVVGAPTETTLSTLYARKGENQTANLTVNTRLQFNSIMGQTGSGISLNSAAGVNQGLITLEAGKSYKLMGSPQHVVITASGFVAFRWYNVTAGAFIGNAASYDAQNNDVQVNGGLAVAYITPTVTTNVELRIESMIGTVTQFGSGTNTPWCSVEQVPTTETILAGHVVPTPLHWVSLSNTSVSSADVPSKAGFVELSAATVVKRNPYNMVVTNAAGDYIEIQQAGRYAIDMSMAISGSINASLTVNGVIVATSVSISANNTASLNYTGEFLAGDQIRVTCTASTGRFSMSVNQQPSSTVVNPDTVPVTELDYVSVARRSTTAATISITAPDIFTHANTFTTPGAVAGRFPLASETITGTLSVNGSNQIVIEQSGRYSIDVNAQMESSAAASSAMQIVKNGTTVLGATNNNFTADPLTGYSHSYVGDLIAGDLIDIRFTSNVVASLGIYSIHVAVEQQPSHSIVKYNPGDVIVESLTYGRMSKAVASSVTVVQGANITGWDVSGPNNVGVTVNPALGTHTITQSGNYDISASMSSRGANAANVIGVFVNGTQRATGTVYAASIQSMLPIEVNCQLDLNVGDVVSIRPTLVGPATTWDHGEFIVEQVPVGVFVDPDTVPVQTLHYGSINSGSNSFSGITAGSQMLTFNTAGNTLGVTANTTTDSLTITQSGLYRVSGTANNRSAAIGDNSINIAKNGVVIVTGPVSSLASAGQTVYMQVEDVVTLAAGDVITMFCGNVAGTASWNNINLSVQQVPGHSIVKYTPGDVVVEDLNIFQSVRTGGDSGTAVYTLSPSSTSVSASVAKPTGHRLKFTSANAQIAEGITVGTDQVTIVTSGRYRLNATLALDYQVAGAADWTFECVRNGSSIIQWTTTTPTAGNHNEQLNLSSLVDLTAGDTIDWRVGYGQSQTANIYSQTLAIEQVPTGLLVDPGAVPVTNLAIMSRGFVTDFAGAGGVGVTATVTTTPHITLGTSFLPFTYGLFANDALSGSFTPTATGVTVGKTGMYDVEFKADVNTTTNGSGSQLIIGGVLRDFGKYNENASSGLTDGQLTLRWSGQITAGDAVQVSPVRNSSAGSDTYVGCRLTIKEYPVSTVQGLDTNLTPVIDDATFATATNTNVPSSSSVVSYVESQLGSRAAKGIFLWSEGGLATSEVWDGISDVSFYYSTTAPGGQITAHNRSATPLALNWFGWVAGAGSLNQKSGSGTLPASGNLSIGPTALAVNQNHVMCINGPDGQIWRVTAISGPSASGAAGRFTLFVESLS